MFKLKKQSRYARLHGNIGSAFCGADLLPFLVTLTLMRYLELNGIYAQESEKSLLD